MKRTKLISILFAMLLIVFSLGLVACKKETVKEEVFGFDVEETITVDAGTNVLVDIPIVTDKNGNPIDVVYDVTTMDGGAVTITANRFFALDEDGYKINYAVITADNVIHTKTTVVKVRGEKNLYAKYEALVEQGAESVIEPVSNFASPEYAYEVTYETTGEKIAVTDGKFVTDELGFYTVKITATEEGRTAEYEYDIYCREAMQDGEVERFTPEWEEVRAVMGIDTFDWKITSSAETGVKDRFGRDAYYVSMTTSAQYGYFWINPRGDEAYYRQLAEEGYTHVSFWIYADCEVNHDVISQLYPDKGAYTSATGTITPDTWTEIKIRLVEDYVDYAGSFASAVEYFQKQQTHILCFDNAPGWNSGGHEENMTIYISDVYAVKSAEIKAVEGAKLDYVTGETLTFSDVVSVPEDLDVAYNIEFRGESTLVTEDSYQFKANGTYTINVIPSSNISTYLKLTVNVTDGTVSSVSDMQVERTGSTVTVDFASLNTTLTNGETPVTIKAYKAYRYGELLESTPTSFTVGVDGGYTIEVEGEYTVDGVVYTTYVNVIIDVWSAESKYIVTYNNLMLAHSEYCGWNNWDAHPSYENGEYAVGGEEGRMLKVTKLGQTFLVMFKPMYSKGYYEMLLAENPSATVTLKYYIASAQTGGSIRSYFDGFESKGYVRNQWVIDTITLEKFVNDYDTMYTGYEEVKYLMDANITKTHSRNEQDFLFWFSGDSRNDIVYIPDIVITTEAKEGAAVLKSGAELTIGEANDLTAILDVTLDGQVAKIATVEVNYAGEWIALPEKTFTPEFGGEYAFRIYAVSGNSYKTVESTVTASGEALTKTDDTALHTLKDGESFDLTPYIKSGYDVEYTVERVIGSTTEEVHCVIENNAVTAENLLQKGNYKITVILVANGNSVFGKFEYYTLNVNYVDTEEYNSASAATLSYAKLWNNWNSATAPYGTATLAQSMDANLTGKSGAYFSADIKPRWAKDADEIGMQLLPLYSKAYYESLLAEGRSYYLTFEWTYVYTYEYETAPASYRYRLFGESADTQGAEFGVWYQAKIDLATLIEHWDTLTAASDKSSARQFRELLYIRTNGGAQQNEIVGTLYIGNFALQKEGVVATGVQLVDTVGKTAYDLTSLYNDVNATASYTATLTDTKGTVTQVADAKAFAVDSVKQGVYTLTLNENGNPAYTATIDLYDSSEGMLWQVIDENSASDAWIWKHGYNSVGAPTVATVSGMTALQFAVVKASEGNTNALGLRIKAIHSYEYYVLMSEKYEAITFDVYVAGANGMNIEVFGDSDGNGCDDDGDGVWHSKNTKVTYQLPVSFLFENWTNLNNLTDEVSGSPSADNGKGSTNATHSMIFTTFYGYIDDNVVSIGNFGSIAKATETA